MKNVNTNAFKAIVWEYLANSVYDTPEGMTEHEAAGHIWKRFNSEYNYEQNRQRIPKLQARVAEWLSGLPLMIEYTYYDITKRAEAWHECSLTDKQAEMIQLQWFKFLSTKLVQMWEHYGIDYRSHI